MTFRVVLTLALFALSACTTAAESPSPYEAPTSQFQADILDDGEVSFAEMERAVFAYSECLKQIGIRTESEFDASIGAYRYSFSGDGLNVSELLDGPDGMACKAETIDIVELVFADQNGPTREEDAEFYANIAECMRKQGYDIDGSDPDSLSALYELYPDEYLACFDSIAGL